MRRVVIVGCLLAGCDPLADGGYVGEPMFTLTGTFAATTAAPDDPVGGLALLWQDSVGAGGPGVAATTVPVAIEFPSTFRVAVPLPPPEIARFTFDDSDVELSEAYVFVVADPAAPRPTPRGLDRAHVLIYASGDVAAGTQAADYLGGPVAGGYHLRRFAPVVTPGPAQRAMIERCVASGATQPACDVRRRYALAAAPDDEYLRIVVSPP